MEHLSQAISKILETELYLLMPGGSNPCIKLAVNTFMAGVPIIYKIIYKPVHWFALQINGLVPVW